jgi:1-acyl-sn-glycerol-3-phosphate acyltransferase
MNPTKPAAGPPDHPFCRPLRRMKDLAVTLILWTYFIAGFAVLFGPFYLLALPAVKHRRNVFQYLNHLFFKIFFAICRGIIPRHQWTIDPRITSIHSSIVACNHLSYLDSILLISLFAKHTTIAKNRLFGLPFMGAVVKHAGYIPSSGRGRYGELLLNSLEAIAIHLDQGGNIIIFPEGTRSRDGRVGELHKGAFKIARYCKAPIKVLKIENSDKLFPPGKFLFNTCIDNTISLKLVGELVPRFEDGAHCANDLMAQFGALLDGSSASNPGWNGPNESCDNSHK